MTLICGIDEAGRGPVIGPLIVAGVLLNKEKEQRFKEKGVKDSKLLSHKVRCQLADFIKREADDYFIITVDVDEIDEAVDSELKNKNLNWLEADKAVEIINKLDPDVAVVDCPSSVPEKFKAYLQNKVDKEVELIVEHKADLNHISCAAASILAKCLREESMEKIQKKYGNTGPGYPSNPVTQEFLKKNWEKHPEIFRKSWASYKNQQTARKQKNLADF